MKHLSLHVKEVPSLVIFKLTNVVLELHHYRRVINTLAGTSL
jgi:hypothetical protein